MQGNNDPNWEGTVSWLWVQQSLVQSDGTFFTQPELVQATKWRKVRSQGTLPKAMEL